MKTPDRSLRILRIVGLFVPLSVTVGALAIQALSLAHLPDPVAIHWGITGEPDGFGPAWTVLLMTAAVGLLLPLVIVGAALVQSRVDPRWPTRGGSYRFVGGVSLGATVFVDVLLTGSLLIQVGLDDARQGPSIGWAMLVGALAGLLAGAMAWQALPADPAGSTPAPAAPAPLDAGERVVWIRTATMARVGIGVLIGAVVLVLAIGVGLLLGGEAPAGWLTIAIGVPLALLCASNAVFHVSVDRTGLTVRSLLGIPRFHVPIADVASSAVVSVQPMAEFGGWGMRWAPNGRFGVVLRTGEALEVTRVSGKTFTVTVDDAETAAALLEAYRTRSETPR